MVARKLVHVKMIHWFDVTRGQQTDGLRSLNSMGDGIRGLGYVTINLL